MAIFACVMEYYHLDREELVWCDTMFELVSGNYLQVDQIVT